MRKVCRNTISMSIGKSCTICFMQSSKIRFPTAGAAHAATPCCTRFPHTHRRPPSACAPLRGNKPTAAPSADHFSGAPVPRGGSAAGFAVCLPAVEFPPDSLEHRARHNRLVMIPQIHLRGLPLIFHLAMIEKIRRAAFALQKIAAVFRPGAASQHHRRRPRFPFSAWRRDALGGQLSCDDVKCLCRPSRNGGTPRGRLPPARGFTVNSPPAGKPVDIIASEHHTALHRALLPLT